MHDTLTRFMCQSLKHVLHSLPQDLRPFSFDPRAVARIQILARRACQCVDASGMDSIWEGRGHPAGLAAGRSGPTAPLNRSPS